MIVAVIAEMSWKPGDGYFCLSIYLQVNEEASAEPTADSEVKDETEAELKEVRNISEKVNDTL